MALFSMFLTSPPADTPVTTVYREKRPFGPPLGDEPGFSASLVMEIAESAPAEFRTVRTCCAAWLRVVGVQEGSSPSDPDAPLVVALEPLSFVIHLMMKLGNKRLFEPPQSFIYTGLDPASLRTNLMPIITVSKYLDPSGTLTPDQLWQRIRGGSPFPLDMEGITLAEVSARNLSEGFRVFSFAARTNFMTVPNVMTPPRNFLDPVRFFKAVVDEKELVQGGLIPPSEAENSWLEVVTKNRVLITVRDEWNSPITDGTSAFVTDGTTQHSVPLTAGWQGTFTGPAGMRSYSVSLPGRKVTRISRFENRAEPAAEFSTEAPAHHVLSSVRPEDWFHEQHPDLTDPTKALSLYTENNAVEALVDGFPTFKRLARDLRKVSSPAHFFLFTNWYIEHTFKLVPGELTSTLKALLENINESGATIRSLIWHHFIGSPRLPLGFNRAAHNFIAGLLNAKSVFDSRTHHTFILSPLVAVSDLEAQEIGGPIGAAVHAVEAAPLGTSNPYHMGSHHAKTYIMRGTEGTVAYVGGIDLNPDRLDGPEHLPINTRFHDVHSRVAGPAAIDLVKAFVYRWNDHPENRTTERTLRIAPPSACPPGETCIDPVPVIPGRESTCMVQIARTFGAKTQDYALNGDRTIWATLEKALDRAKKYVYIEDQYLTSPTLSSKLLDLLSRIEHLIVVIDHWGETKPYGKQAMARARYLFLKPLVDAFLEQKKLHVFTLVKDGRPYKVHTKVVIIDDVFATIGSANMCRRSLTHDTEANAFFLDGRVIGGVRKFARDLRVQLWAEHLGWKTGKDTIHLWNIDKAIEILTKRRPATARLQQYDFSRGEGSEQMPFWNDVFDPDGTEEPRPPGQ